MLRFLSTALFILLKTVSVCGAILIVFSEPRGAVPAFIFRETVDRILFTSAIANEGSEKVSFILKVRESVNR